MAASATATKERPNKVHITDAGPSRKKVSIEIPKETVDEQLGSSIDTLIADVDLPGFRKGHAPRRLVEKRFGETIRKEAKNQLVAAAFSKAVEDNKLRVLGEPTSETLPTLELKSGEPLKFEFEVEVLPTFDLPKLDGIAVKKPLLTVTDEMVAKEIDRLKLNEGGLKDKPSPQPGDYLTGHAVMKGENGETVLDIDDAVIQLPTPDKNGKGMILGVMVDDFEKQLGKPKVGDNITIKTIGPENHENEAVRQKKLTISYKVKTAQEIVPATLEEVAQRYGMETADDVRATVRQRIDQRLQVEQQAAMREQVARHLVGEVEMDVPERITATQSARNLERQRMELTYRGMDPLQVEEKLAEIRSASDEVAVRELKLFFVLDKAAEEMGIKVSDAEINGRIAQMAAQRGERPEKLRQDIISRNQIGTVYAQIREHKAMDAIIAKAKVEEVSLEDFKKHMEQFAAADRKGGAPKGGASHKPKPSKSDEGEDKPHKPEHAHKASEHKPAHAPKAEHKPKSEDKHAKPASHHKADDKPKAPAKGKKKD